MNELFPIFLKTTEFKILLIGGGPVALEKLHFLLKSSPLAQVDIVAKNATPKMKDVVAKHQHLNLVERAFEQGDIKAKKIVIVAANNQVLNEEIYALSKEGTFLLNTADQAAFCDFYLGGIVTKGDLKLAISTNGKAPILARRLREFFEHELPGSIGETMKQLHTLRKTLSGSFDQKLKAVSEITKNIIEK